MQITPKRLNPENIGTLNSSSELQEVYPSSIKELKHILSIAREKQTALYPISTGRNWGLGSKVPPKKALIVNLSKLNKIHSFDEELGILEISPGTTQIDVYEFLKSKNAPFYLEVTGSSANSSVIGNALERGITYEGLRQESITELEVLMSNEQIIKTGMGRFENNLLSGIYKYGVGPDLSGLFYQGNFGIVTKAKIRLKRKRQTRYYLRFICKENALPQLVIRLRKLFQNGYLDSILHLADRQRIQEIVAPIMCDYIKQNNLKACLDSVMNKEILCDWSGLLAIKGDKKIAKTKLKFIKKELKDLGELQIIPTSLLPMIELVAKKFQNWSKSITFFTTKPLRELSEGIPTNETIRWLLSPNHKGKIETIHAEQVDYQKKKMLYCLPLAPMTEEGVKILFEGIDLIKKDFNPAVTLNPISEYILEAVISIQFDDNYEKVKKKIRELEEFYLAKKISVYRTNIDNMDLYQNPNCSYQQTLVKVKQALDPNCLISPGRYLEL